MQLYSEILDNAGPSYRQIFIHIRDKPNTPILFHCTAGKDRTGLIAALILRVRSSACCHVSSPSSLRYSWLAFTTIASL
jgi:protein tyrosine phosphatase